MKKVFLLWGALTFSVLILGQNRQFEETASFFPGAVVLDQDRISWGFQNVPENWEAAKSRTIKIAVSVLKNLSNTSNADAIVFLQGGPGAGSIQNIGFWRDHPLRNQNDIVLVDMRGTGFSQPRLCPDLGKSLLQILAKNQTEKDDENQKAAAALSCKQDLLDRGVDIKAYNSMSMARDLNALKNQLGYRNWHVYGASYGTYVAQVYANMYANDIKTLILDSSIDDITSYYTQNTSNYINSLSRVFKMCENDEACHSNYPDLENVYYKTILDIRKNPITVTATSGIVEGKTFTFNDEDFKVAIQQALYNKELIEVMPLLIYQFQERNVSALGKLVAAFSNLLSMDYGVYYCVSCNETLPYNNKEAYAKDVLKHKKLLGGISFYKSDFKVCDEWNFGRTDSLKRYDMSKLDSLLFPVIVFSGEYDPITPASNGKKVAQKFKNGRWITVPNYGHASSFTSLGRKMLGAFVNNPNEKLEISHFQKTKKVSFVKKVIMNSGISKMGESLNQPDFIFIFPLCIALGVMLISMFNSIVKIIKKKYISNSDIIINSIVPLTSALGLFCFGGLIFAILQVSSQNYYILAFGLPYNFGYIFTLLLVFIVLFIITLIYFIFKIRKIKNRSIVFSVVFSNMLLITYLLYWGILL